MIRAALLGFAVGVTASLAWLPSSLRALQPYERQWIAPRRRS